MSSILGKIPRFTLKLPSAFAKGGRTMSECPLELSFSLCEDGSCVKNKIEEEIPLQVQIPQEPDKQDDISVVNKEALEKAEEETSEKQDNMEVTCSVSVDGQEKQEFSFTLYDFDTCDRSNKQDIEKVVVRSICEALNKTLKLPPSGSRTIKVKLAISPDSSKESDTLKEPLDNTAAWTTVMTDSLKVPSPAKHHDCCSAQSVNTTSTYLPSSLSEKPPKYSSPSITRSPQVVQKSPANIRAMPSPKLRSSRQYRLNKADQKNHLREKLQIRVNASDNRHQLDDFSQNFEDDTNYHHKHPSSRDHVPECRDRRNHYLDLAGVESPKCNNLLQQTNPCGENLHSDLSGLQSESHQHNIRPDPKYMCPYRLLDRSHQCSKPHRTRECPGSSPLKKPLNYHSKFNTNSEGSPKVYRKVNIDPNDDLLNLDYDLSELVPEVKFDWEKPGHRRSKSYDLYENNVVNGGGFYSPKLKPKNNQNWASILESQKLANHLASSPGHHYRHRHRDRERQRAMQQVASWIAKEHSNAKADSAKQFVKSTMSPNKQLSERHEHHHLHEHVHHHYHHFVEF